jgi:outer membrane protein insertion porin family
MTHLHQKATSGRQSLIQLAVEAGEALTAITRVARNAAEVDRFKPVADKAAERSPQQLARIDQTVDRLVASVQSAERVSESFEEGIARPIREGRAISAGVRSALAVLFRYRAARAATKERRGTSSRFHAWTVLLAVLSVADYQSFQLSAQEVEPSVSFEGQKVALVDLVGRPGSDVEGLQPLVLQRAGELYSEQKVKATVDALMRTGRFRKVDIEVKPEATGLRVSFVMQPAFYIGVLSFPGAEKVFSYPQLLQVVNYPSEEPYEESRVREAEISLQRFLAMNGYFLAHVQSNSKFDEINHVADIAFDVTLNQHAKFGRIEVSGPPPDQAARLELALRSFLARLKSASVKPGKPYDFNRLRAAQTFIPAYLSKENRLATEVRLNPPKYDPETNRADVSFQVTLGPVVKVQVTGARVSKRTLRKLIPVYEENAFDQDLVEEGERNLVSYFQTKGYFDVKVSPQVGDERAEITLVYQVEKGRRHRVAQVAIHGNRHFDEDDLRPLVAVQKGRFSPGKLSNDLLKRSADQLGAYYRDAGYQDVKVEPKVVDREPQVFITFEITEGQQTTVEAFHVEGNQTQPINTLAPDGLKLKPGQPYSQRLLNQDRDQIMARYLDFGYLAAVFKSTVKPLSGAPPRVEVTYEITEGPQTRISSVVDLGRQQTRKEYVYRTADVHAGRPLSQRKLLDSESALYNAGIFDWASVGPRRPITDQSQESVLVKVHEAKRNTLTYGLGLEISPRTANVPAGSVALPGLPSINLPKSVQVTQKQYVSPRGSIEYSRRNLRGLGETASVSALASRLDQRATFTYSDPHFRGLNWSSLLSVSGERTTENPLFTARLGDASFQLLRTLDRAKTKTLVFRYSFTRTSLTNLLIPELVLPEDRSVRLSTLSASYIRDTRDKPLDAHRGLYQSLDFGVTPKVIGSSANFVRFFGQTAHYKQLRPWLVWANDVRFGLAKPFAGSVVPLSERFFSGGATSLRGFPEYGAGPQRLVPVCSDPAVPSTCTNITVPVGGDALFIFNSEGRFPIPIKKGIGGVIFYDGGNVYRTINLHDFVDNYTNTVGFGLRYDTPVGPIRFDVGRNLSPVPGLKATQYFISLGQSF